MNQSSIPNLASSTTTSSADSFQIDTLIIVACHAIYMGGPTDGIDESEWLIEPFQVGETPTFTEHIRRGIEELAQSKSGALLVFSGGATKKLKTSGKVVRTEAQGYMDIARRRGLFGFDQSSGNTSEGLQHRMFEENYATDSYQNVLLSLIQYSVWVQKSTQGPQASKSSTHSELDNNGLMLPRRLMIVSHEFKRARFLELHLPAIQSIWPSKHDFNQMEVEYIGINPPFDEQKIREIEEGDRKRGFGAWEKDLLGTGELLSGKRRERGWDETEFLSSMNGYLNSDTLSEVKKLVRGEKVE